jgi:hypothetical protein
MKSYNLVSPARGWSPFVAGLVGGVAIAASVALSPAVAADNAYIDQANGRSFGAASLQNPAPASIPVTQFGARQTAFIPTPETATPARNGNFAQTLQIGSFNHVFQSQSGANNASNVGILGGSRNNVGVWQRGNDLSNLYLINGKGLSVGVIQPPGSAPVNMLIARLPNGGLLIKR